MAFDSEQVDILRGTRLPFRQICPSTAHRSRPSCVPEASEHEDQCERLCERALPGRVDAEHLHAGNPL